MLTTIDKAGRLVVPQALRLQAGLLPGTVVDIQPDGSGLHIEPATTDDVASEDDLLVIPASGTRLTDAAVRDLRLGDQR